MSFTEESRLLEPRTDRSTAARTIGLRRFFGAVVPVVVPVIFWFLPLNMEPKAQHAIAITLFMILAWATEMMDHGLTGLIGCYLFWALNIVSFNVAFSGFANDTPWFLM